MRYKCAIIKVIDIVVDILGRGFMMDPKRKRLYMIIGAVIAIVIAVAAGYLYYMRTPTYTLRTIGNAVKTHDWASFQKHVDVKGIFNNTYDRMIEEEAAKQQGPDAQLMRGFATLLKPMVVETLTQQVQFYVQNGKAMTSTDADNAQLAANGFTTDSQGAKSGAGSAKKQDPMSSLADSSTYGSLEFKGYGTTRSEDGFDIVPLNLHDKELNTDFTVELKVRQLDDGTWQIVDLPNLPQVLEQLDQARKAKK